MSDTFAPRQAQAGQRISYAAGDGSIHTLEAVEIDEGRWFIQPETNDDEAAVVRHGLEIDEELAAQQAADSQLAGEALESRARELDIPGRSRMNADQLRAAIAEREAEAEDPAPAPPADETTEHGAGTPAQEE